MSRNFPVAPRDFTRDFVEAALGAVPGSLLALRFEPVGTGQVCDSYRFHCEWAAGSSDNDKRAAPLPVSFVAKCPSHDATSRAAAALFRLYAMEVGWYRDAAPFAGVACPGCYHADIAADGQQFVLMLQDMAPARQGDQIAGASLIQVETTLAQAARLHSWRPANGGLENLGWANSTAGNADYLRAVLPTRYAEFRQRFAALLSADVLDLGQKLIARFDAYLDGEAVETALTHGDMRLDNILFHADGRIAALVDWQTCAQGSPANDVAYLIGTSFADPAQRRAAEGELIAAYLAQRAAHGAPIDPDSFWRDYRRSAFAGFIMAINASLHVEQTERGDAMFAAMAARPAAMAIDHDSLSLI
jgi:hypothetical protein